LLLVQHAKKAREMLSSKTIKACPPRGDATSTDPTNAFLKGRNSHQEKEILMANNENTHPMHMPTPDPALKRLEKLVGTWELKGRTLHSKEDNITGWTTFGWMPEYPLDVYTYCSRLTLTPSERVRWMIFSL